MGFDLLVVEVGYRNIVGGKILHFFVYGVGQESRGGEHVLCIGKSDWRKQRLIRWVVVALFGIRIGLT